MKRTGFFHVKPLAQADGKAERFFLKIYYTFRSVQLAIVLLSLLAIGIMVGVFLPQESLTDPLEIRAQYGQNYYFMKALGLFTVYSSPWFLTLEVLFFFNLLIGSFKWLKTAWMSATIPLFLNRGHIIRASKQQPEILSTLDLATTQATLTKQLKQWGYSVKTKTTETGETLLFAAKANWSRLGPVMAHIGILSLLLASLFGAFTGFKGQELATPGETIDMQNLERFTPNINASAWLGSIPEVKLTVKDFRIEFYPNDPTVVKQYYCTLIARDNNGKVLSQKTISVNDPMVLGDLSIYQASFAPTGKFWVKINGKKQALSVNSQFGDRQVIMIPTGKPAAKTGLTPETLILFPFLVQQDPGVTHSHMVAFVHDGKGFLGAAPGKMPENLKLFEGEHGKIGTTQIEFIQPEYATGLQIKKAPETGWVYLSFLVIILGTAMCFFAQRKLWFALTPTAHNKTQIAWTYWTKKAPVHYLETLKKRYALLQQKLSV